MNNQRSNVKYTFIIIALVSTTLSTLLLKLQDNQISLGYRFLHPFLQSFCMFLGEQICLYWYYIQQKSCKLKPSQGSPLLFVFPAILDLIASCFYTFGLAFCTLSVAQIIFSFQIVITAILSRVILKKHIHSQQTIGILLVFVGTIVTGFSSLTLVDEDYTSGVGVFLVILANIIWPIQFVTEERLFNTYNYNAMEAIGYEGLSGSTIYLLLIPIMLNINCTPVYLDNTHRNGFCIFGKLEEPQYAIQQMLTNKTLIATTVLYIMLISFVNFSMIAVIKFGSAISSVTVSSMRVLILWIVALLSGWESFHVLELVGFILVLIGSLFYNNVVTLPGLTRELEE